ncbi:hypothetical protein [Halopolyspora algeriensis]|uniref:spermine/spermidine synthase domain-containing protein n=1 Tax=Halopolyspora algeriensis TaxID=1500506 RepID=UPI001FEBF3B0|nr:hypothetical protein [Halopolyspora algeriensis]
MARAATERGETVLIRRGDDGALELRVNGVFVMDTVHTATERLLATTTLEAYYASAGVRAATAPIRVLIGGLGLGFTLQEVLADRRVSRVRVAEIESAIVDWHRRGLIPDTVAIEDERVELVTGEITELIADQAPSSVEAILLDVDNGPGYLVYTANAAVYSSDFLAVCHETLSPYGVTAIWSADPAPELEAAMRDVFEAVEELTIPVMLGRHSTTYHLYVGRRV